MPDKAVRSRLAGTRGGGRVLTTFDEASRLLAEMPGLEIGRHYAKAPITEVVLELHVSTDESRVLDDVADLKFGDGFQRVAPMYNLETHLDVTDGEMTSSIENSQIGMTYAGEEGSTVQAAIDRFAFVKRGEYDTWERFASEAERHWLVYKSGVRPAALTRASVRFVNRIPLPPRSVEIKDYVRTSVDVSAYLPQAVNGLFMQVDIPISQLNVDATITSALLTVEPPLHPTPGILLDIDVKQGLMLDTQDPSFDEQLRRTLDTLRLAKNYVFEACITDATRGLID